MTDSQGWCNLTVIRLVVFMTSKTKPTALSGHAGAVSIKRERDFATTSKAISLLK
jgi:hypothetical protein